MAKYSILIIGGGSIGERHLRCFLNTDRVTISLCDTSEAIREKIAMNYPIEKTYADLDGALADRFDAAVICSPAHLHIPMAQRLADHRLHLLIEKPLSLSTDGIEQLQTTISEKRLVTAVAYVHRANPIIAAMRETIISGRFGRPLSMLLVTGQNFPYFRPAYREIYYRDHKTGGGAIHDALSHMINAAEWIIGPTDRIMADAAHLKLEGVEVEDMVHLLARHGDVLADYSLNQYQAQTELYIQIECEKATVRCEPLSCQIKWMDTPEGQWQIESFEQLERDYLFKRQADIFLDAIQGKREPLCSLEEGIQTMKTILTIHRSIRQEDRFMKVE